MTTQDAGGIRVRILGDDSDLQQKLRDSTNELVKWGAAATAAAATSAVALTARSSEAAREIQNLSSIAGLSTGEFQRMAAGARTIGIEQDKLSDIVKDVSDKVGDFIQTGAGPMADFFEQIAPQIGVTADQFRNLNGADALQLYVSSLEKANLSQSEMTFFMEAIASDANALLPLMRNNGQAMNEVADRAERLGTVLSEIEVQQLADAGQAFDDVKQVIDGVTDSLAVELSPIIQAVADEFLEAAEDTGGFQSAVETAFNMTIKGAAFAADALRGIEVVIKGLEIGFWGLQAGSGVVLRSISEGVDSVVNGAKATINTLIDAVNAIPFIDPLEKLETGSSGITDFFTEATEAATQNMQEKIAELHELLMEPMPGDSVLQWAADVKEAAEQVAETQVRQREEQSAHNEAVAETNTTFREKEKKDAKKLADDLKAIQHQSLMDRLSITSQMFGNIGTLMNTENKRLFQIGKIAAISQAGVDGISAAISSYKEGAKIGGPIVGAAFAGTSLIATGSMIAQLSSRSFGDTSNPSAPASGATDPGAGAEGGQGGGVSSTLRVSGLDRNSLFTGDMVRELAGKLLDFQADGGQVVL
jgi:hypothetical protein